MPTFTTSRLRFWRCSLRRQETRASPGHCHSCLDPWPTSRMPSRMDAVKIWTNISKRSWPCRRTSPRACWLETCSSRGQVKTLKSIRTRWEKTIDFPEVRSNRCSRRPDRLPIHNSLAQDMAGCRLQELDRPNNGLRCPFQPEEVWAWEGHLTSTLRPAT